MNEAMQMARVEMKIDEVPVGAVLVKNGKILGRGFNQVITNNSVTSHAEILAINEASSAIGNYRLNECEIYVTLDKNRNCFWRC